MKISVRLTTLLCMITTIVLGQVPSPGQGSTSSAKYKKTSKMGYEVSASGKVLTNMMDLKYLKTSTLGVLDKTNRTIYLLEDFENTEVGSTGNATVLTKNVAKDFYITNPNSFANYVNDQYVSSGKFTNVNGSYVYYDPGTNKTYYLDGIRNFQDWGAKSTYALPFAETNTYWTRISDKETYHIIKEGQSINYDAITTEKSGNDLLIKEDGTYKFKLSGYYTTASYVFKPIEKYTTQITSETEISEGCVSGNCEDGWGKWQYKDAYYDGFWENGKKNGYGLYKWVGTGKYIGNWKNDQMQGYGIYIADNEDTIGGWYNNGQLNGVGYSVKGDSWEQGIYTDGTLTTPYTFYKNDVETGCTAGDCGNKYGKFVWNNGDMYVGFFKNGKMYLGSYTFANGDKYSGTFSEANQFDGFGRFFFKSGDYYGGEWKNGNYNGKGYFHNKEYEKRIGLWKDQTFIKSL